MQDKARLLFRRSIYLQIDHHGNSQLRQLVDLLPTRPEVEVIPASSNHALHSKRKADLPSKVNQQALQQVQAQLALHDDLASEQLAQLLLEQDLQAADAHRRHDEDGQHEEGLLPAQHLERRGRTDVDERVVTAGVVVDAEKVLGLLHREHALVYDVQPPAELAAAVRGRDRRVRHRVRLRRAWDEGALRSFPASAPCSSSIVLGGGSGTGDLPLDFRCRCRCARRLILRMAVGL